MTCSHARQLVKQKAVYCILVTWPIMVEKPCFADLYKNSVRLFAPFFILIEYLKWIIKRSVKDYLLVEYEPVFNNIFLVVCIAFSKYQIFFLFPLFSTTIKCFYPWLVWLSGLSASLQTKGLLVQFLGRAHA